MSGSEINFDAPKTVGLFMGSNDFMRLIMGPVGSGKSSGCCVEIVRRSMETPAGKDGVRRSRHAVVRNTYPELRDTTMKTWDEWVPEPFFGKWQLSEHTFDLYFELEDGTKVEAEVMFRALDRPQDVKKLLSLELTSCYFNEWREIPKAVTDMMQTRVGRYPRKEDVPRYWTGVFGDTNPPDTDHYLYKLFEEEKPEGHRIFKQPSGFSDQAENIEHLDACWDPTPEELGYPAHALGLPVNHPTVRVEYHKAQRWMSALNHHESPCRCYYPRLCRGKDDDFKKVYARGEYGYVREGKPIYPEFQDSIHCVDGLELLPGAKKILIGNDYGLTPAAVWVQQDPQDGQYQVLREHVAEHMGATRFGEEQARICKKEFKGKEFEGWGDPAGMAGSSVNEAETPINVVSAQGVPMSAAPTNDFTVRRDAVGNLLTRLTRLGRPALVISSKCIILRKGMNGGYCFRRIQVSGDARFEDKPLKNHFSHVCEALQYAMVGAGEDQAVLTGGQPDRVHVNVRVYKALGGSPQAPIDDEHRPAFKVRRGRRD